MTADVAAGGDGKSCRDCQIFRRAGSVNGCDNWLEFLYFRSGNGLLDLAIGAKAAGQALGDDGVDGWGDHICRQADIDQAGDSFNGRIGVKGGEKDVAG